MAVLSVKDAAARLGVSERRVRAMLEDGKLEGQKVGGRWLVDLASDSLSAKDKLPIKPLSERSSWLLMIYADLLARLDAAPQADASKMEREHDPNAGDIVCDMKDGNVSLNFKLRVSPVEKHRLRDRLERLSKAEDPVSLLRSWLPNRAERWRLHINPADLADLRSDDRIELSGVSHPASGLLAGNEVEAYVGADDACDVRDDYLLVEPRPDSPVNVVLHVVGGGLRLPSPEQGVPLIAVAADLAERSGVREKEAARNLVRRALADQAS